ncbi:MAG: tRNA sulfurtransferase [Candidatus Asgardarchaeia archaeon]
MYDAIIIGISEIWTKSENVRQLLMRRLFKNIKAKIPDARIEIRRGRLVLRPFKEEYLEKLKKTFGIRYFAPVWVVETDLEKITNKVCEALKDRKGKFKVSVKRVWKKLPFTSVEAGRIIAREVAKKNPNLEPEIKYADFEVFIEMHKDITFIFTERFEAYDGYPVGSGGRVLALFSGGIDSPVAVWFAAKRGLAVDLFLLNLAGKIYEGMAYKVYKKLLEWVPSAKFYVIDGIELIEEIIRNVREGYRQIVFKVYLYKIAEKVSEKLGVKAIVTGESLGQVSTQTLDSLVILDKVVSVPIIRPLIAFNKEEIKKIASEVGTLELSEKIAEVCMLEKHSTASPKENIVSEEVDKVKVDIDQLVDTLRLAEESYEEDIFELTPRNLKKSEVEVIDLEKSIPQEVPKSKKILFLCPSGLTAYYFAKKYRKKGIEAYSLDYKTARRLGFL